ncbi:MAG: methyltransferase domain-containing protein, partial [Planctomycetota bacterium]
IGSSVLHHLDLARVLPELCRVLKPGGRFAFAEPNALNPVLLAGHWLGIGHGCRQASPDERPFSRFRAVRELARHGFLVQRVQPFDFLHPSTPRPLHGLVEALGKACETLPLVREVAGSLLIAARKP